MAELICTTETLCAAQIYEQAEVNPNREKSVWAGLRRLTGSIGDYALEVYRYNNDPEPVFSNGGARVLFRSDRIDLV